MNTLDTNARFIVHDDGETYVHVGDLLALLCRGLMAWQATPIGNVHTTLDTLRAGLEEADQRAQQLRREARQ